MNKNWLKVLVAISAVTIAGSAAFFSVTGLGVLFSGAAMAVMIMAGSLEFAKLVTATYLKQEWDNIQGVSKWYLTSAVVILMLITSAGIFGYLSNAFQQQNLKLDQVAREIQVWQNKIDYTNQQITTLQGQQKDLSTTQNTLISKGNVNNRLLRSVDNRDRQSNTINKKINSLQDSVVVYNGKINEIKNNNIGIEREVGGFRFVAESFGVQLNTVVKFFIILIVIVFDPLAVALIISFNQLVLSTRKKDEDEEINEPSNPEDLKNFVDESARLHLSEEDLKILENALLNPPKPNEELKEAFQRHEDLVKDASLKESWVLNDEEILERAREIEYRKTLENNSNLNENINSTLDFVNDELDEEITPIGDEIEEEDIVNDQVDEMVDEDVFDFEDEFKDETINDTPISREETQMIIGKLIERKEPFFPEAIERAKDIIENSNIEEISTIEPIIEEKNGIFSTIEPNTENIFQNNIEDYEGQFEDWKNETVSDPFEIVLVNQPEIQEVINDVETETFSEEPTNLDETSSDSDEDEKKK